MSFVAISRSLNRRNLKIKLSVYKYIIEPFQVEENGCKIYKKYSENNIKTFTTAICQEFDISLYRKCSSSFLITFYILN